MPAIDTPYKHCHKRGYRTRGAAEAQIHMNPWARIPTTLSIEERIPIWKARSVINDQGCWIYQGYRSTGGYASVSIKDRDRPLHVVVWEHLNGPVPKGKELDHLCRNTACWNPNPEHLEAVTHAENVRRGRSGEYLRARTHCPR